MTKPERGRARVEVSPVVSGIGNCDFGVLGAIIVRVSNQRGFPVVGELGVGDSDASASVGNVQKTIVAMFWMSNHLPITWAIRY